MKKYDYYIGIDVSKNKLDVCFKSDDKSQKEISCVITNDLPGFKEMARWIKKQCSKKNSQGLFCMEHTGVYAMPVSCFLAENGYEYTLVPAIVIKKSMGIKRGKNDKADARDIARFIGLKHDELVRNQFPEKIILKIKMLLSYRDRLVTMSKSLSTLAKETSDFVEKDICKEMVQDSCSLSKSIDTKIKKVEKMIMEIVKSEPRIEQAYNLLYSIPGVGMQVALNMIVCTRCFTAFENAKQFACYCGIAPFEYTSGTTIRGKTRVSALANKKMKALLTMAALNSIQHDNEIKHYYGRKLAEGKNPMLVINAIKNKIVNRIFAVIHRQTPYVVLDRHAA